MRLALIAAFGLMMAAACGDDSVNIAATQDNYCDQEADVACHNLYQCCSESEIESALRVSDPRTELQCRDDFAKLCGRAGAQLRDSLKAGRVTFDPNKLNECLQQILAPEDTCSMVVMQKAPWEDACKDVPWVGTVAVGGACVFQFDCAGAPDTFCGPDLKCKMKPTAGFPCGTGCASAYYCQTSTGTCAPKLANGAPCQSSAQCDKDLFCDTKGTPDTVDDVCAPKGAGGASCSQTSSSAANSACLSGQCIPGTCSGTSTTCYSSASCGGHCSISGNFCTNTPSCNPGGTGNCTGNNATCTTDAYCAGMSAGTCLFTQTCQMSECVGDVVCTALNKSADYCKSVSAIPYPIP